MTTLKRGATAKLFGDSRPFGAQRCALSPARREGLHLLHSSCPEE